MSQFFCLDCGYEWPARKEEVLNKYRLCPKCDSIDVIRKDDVVKAASLANTMLLPKLFPSIDNIRAIMLTQGLVRFKAVNTLKLEEILYRMRVQKKDLDQVLSELFPRRAR